VILPSLLHVDDKDLLQPKGPLSQHVALNQAGQFPLGPVSPELVEVEPVFRVVVDILQEVRKERLSIARGVRNLKHTTPRGQKMV